MHKDTAHYDTSKIAVDFYHPQKNGSFICSCYTPGAPACVESEYLVKVVTYQELKDNIADSFGMVDISFADENRSISFDKYLSGLSFREIMIHCASVINAREFRTHLFNPAIHYSQNKSAA